MIEPFKAAHLIELTLQPQQSMWQGRIDPMLAFDLESTDAWTLKTDRIIGCGGVLDRGSGRGEAWALVAQDAGRAMLVATRAVRARLDASSWRRIEAVTAVGFLAGERWCDMLGFHCEGLMRAYCEDGSDAKRWARIR